jgi:nicotinamidase/pyrazinamidase
MLLLVDDQLGFIEKDRPLAVPGAIDDTRRTIEWIFRNIERLSYIAASLDSHLPFQIFFPSWWIDAATGELLNAFDFTSVTLANLLTKKIKPIFDFDYEYEPGKKMKWSEYYLTELEKNHKKQLAVWPYHPPLGAPEHAIEPSLMEAIYFHAGARSSQPHFEIKGSVPQTENYSIMEVEVPYSGNKNAGINNDFLNLLQNFDLIYIAGQAKSHCVLETINSIVHFFGTKAPEVLSRVRILTDCMSPVGGFETMSDQAFADLTSKNGLKLVKSTDPIG